MSNFFHQYNRKIWIVAILTLIIAIIAYPNLPESIPIHFDAAGIPDNYGSRWTIFLFPALNFAFIFFADSLRKIDPKAETYKKFEPHYYNIIFIVALLLLGIQFITLAYVFGYEVNIARLMPVILGLLFIFIGNVMPKFKHNYFVGIKTSWTLASETVWYHTHRLAGKVWVISGLIMLFLTFLPLNVIPWTTVGLVLMMVVIPVVASYYYYKKYER